MEEWNNIPEVGDHSLKRKREKEKEIFTPVPDSVVEAERMHNSMETYLDPRQQLFGGFDSSDASTSRITPRFSPARWTASLTASPARRWWIPAGT